MNSEILNDKRPIQSFCQMPYGEDGAYWKVGLADCTAIEVYGEPGPHCALPWVKISISGVVRFRSPAAHGEIFYAEEAHPGSHGEQPDDRPGQGGR